MGKKRGEPVTVGANVVRPGGPRHQWATRCGSMVPHSWRHGENMG